MLRLDLTKGQFSRRGSYLAISHIGRDRRRFDNLNIRTMHGNREPLEVFEIEFFKEDGEKLNGSEEAGPAVLSIEKKESRAEICFEDTKTLRIRGTHCIVRLTLKNAGYDHAIACGENAWVINNSAQYNHYCVSMIEGNISVKAPWQSVCCPKISVEFRPGQDGVFDASLEEFMLNPRAREHKDTFCECADRVGKEFEAFLSAMPPCPGEFADARELAAYALWSSYVSAEGNYKREALLMSKNWMNCVWSWDHCFNTMALSCGLPKEAWDQFMIVFDMQHESGALPDFINDRAILWNFTKTPIHGWTLSWLYRRGRLSQEQIRESYEPLIRWTDWWFQWRDYDGDGMPQCNHGNDSISDNCTVFDKGCPLETPVLAAFLILQLDYLSEAAELLGKPEEAEDFRNRADALMEQFLKHFWDGNRLIARLSGTHEAVEADSIYLYVPIVLGKRLPEEIRAWLLEGLKKEGYLLTQFGFATESPESPLYESDSYCRGPVWAMITMMVTEGLRACGEEEFVSEVAGRFCRMVKKSGMAECFDALTGEGLRDPSYTWTASVFLVLASEWCR